uniref:(California timema) hypothetical protein n=1 Tax=Timema californicum TaxID=61474 RepID=A0A7R9PBD5_TIMCA|nr:unnamed protein product [Timema californicum]
MPSKAPVAKLEEFDILYDSHNLLSPTRPPRIVKKLLSQGMLTTHSDSTPPELPAKKSLPSHNTYQSSPKECSPTIRDECCIKYPKFAKVLKDFEATPRCQKLSLKHYMLKPIQRIPQYRLLLDDYLRNLLCESPDYEDTKTALKIVCDVADHANRSLKLGELEQEELDNVEDDFSEDNFDGDPDFVEIQDTSDTEASECASNLPDNNQPGCSKNNIVLTGKSGCKWHTADSPRRGRTRTEDIVIHFPFSKGAGQNAKSPKEAWELLIDDDIISTVTFRTNEEIMRNIPTVNQRKRYPNNTDSIEVKQNYITKKPEKKFTRNARIIYNGGSTWHKTRQFSWGDSLKMEIGASTSCATAPLVADRRSSSVCVSSPFLSSFILPYFYLQSQLGESDFEVIKPGRVVIREGELFKLSRKVMQPRYFILLNDCLLYTSYYGGSMPSSGLKLNYVLSLTGMKVFIPKAEDYQNEFSIISTTRSFMLSARSLEEQKEWVKVLKNAIKENESRQLTFKSKTFLDKSLNYTEESPDPFKLGREWPCQGSEFETAVLTQPIDMKGSSAHNRHLYGYKIIVSPDANRALKNSLSRFEDIIVEHVVCGSCSDNRAPLEYKNYESARVCSDCYDTLLKEFEESEMIKGSGKQANELYRVRARFKKSEVDTGKKVKYVPQRLLEVTANDTGSQLNGWLQKRTRRSWKRYWFVLKEQVLYAYKASEDVVALESIPVLGYKVVTMNKVDISYA